MEIIAYTSKGCFYCDQLKLLFQRADLEYTSILVDDGPEYNKGSTMSRNEFKQKYPNAVGFPHVIIDGEQYGGLVNTAKYLVKNGYVSQKR
jgi:glutaredoxin|tara:strand:- start:7290 stop:7562 length:273 start_codon:yes stop_codon:yes gene_type:complete